MIGVKPLFGDKNVAEGDKADFDVVFVAPDGKPLARGGLRYELLKLESAISGIARVRPGNTSRSNRPSASPMAISTLPPTSRRGSRCRRSPAAIASMSNRPKPMGR